MSLRSLMLGLGLALVAAPVAHAQPRRPPPPEAADDGPPTPERREQIKKKIRTMRAFTLTEELALDEATAGRLFPALARFDDETDKLLQRRVELQRKLRHVDSIREPEQIQRLINEAIANQRAFRDLEDRKITELRRILPPPQMAKILVVMPALERKIQNQLRKAIVGKLGGKKAAPVLDDDDDLELDGRGLPPAGSAAEWRRGATDERPMQPRGAPIPARSNAPGNTRPCNPQVEDCR